MSFIRPDFHPLWATSGSAIDPGPSKRATGWVALEKPAFTTFNFLDQQQSEFIEYLETTVLDSESLWKMSAFKANDRMTVDVTSGLTGTLSPKDGVFSVSDVGAIYNADGQKTTWSGQDLINTGDNTHVYPASRDTYIAYNDALRTFEYNDVPNDDPAPTPTAGFLNFQRVVTDGSDITGTNDTLPTNPPFTSTPTFSGIGLGNITQSAIGGSGNPALVIGNDDGTVSGPQFIKMISRGGSNDTRIDFHSESISDGPVCSIGKIPSIENKYFFQVRVSSGFVTSNLRTVLGVRTFPGADFPVQLAGSSIDDDFLTVIDHDAEVSRMFTVVGRITVDGSGGTVHVFNMNLAGSQRALLHVVYTQRTAADADFQQRKYYINITGGNPTTGGTFDAVGVNSGGFTGNDILHVGTNNVAEIHVQNTGGVNRRYNFRIECIVDNENAP